MTVDIRTIKTADITELFISASPDSSGALEQQAQQLFTRVREVLQAQNARIFQERIFGSPQALRTIRPIRADVLADLDDGVEPTWLVVTEGIKGGFAGLQVHAIAGCGNPEILRLDDKPCGRIVRGGQREYLALSGITATHADDAPTQAQQMLEKAETVLKQNDADMFAVARTWMWLNDILSWYGDFNRVRNQFFAERGIVSNTQSKMPASTGIGIGPEGKGACTMDLAAIINHPNEIEYLNAGGNQDSAYMYGSAFSRATRVRTLAGLTVFVSGTASIDAEGNTTNLDDAEKQIQATIDNVLAVIRQMDCDEEDLVQTIVYCKTREIEKLFYEKWKDFSWPHITVVTDICRDDLLFEIEATAMKAD